MAKGLINQGPRIASAADSLAEPDQTAVAAAFAPRASMTRLPSKLLQPDAIKNREKDLRALNEAHMLELALSIGAVGMIHPPVVDESDTLLAGAHRVAALRFMKEAAAKPVTELQGIFEAAGFKLEAATIQQFQSAYDKQYRAGVPVVVRALSGEDAERTRLEIEISENEKRSDFTREDLKNIVDRLESAGYKRTAGRPKPGELVLSQELQRIIGKSRATVFRVLEEIKDGPTAKHEKSQAAKAAEKKASEVLETKVQIREADDQAGSIVIHYSSTRQRSALLKQLGLKD